VHLNAATGSAALNVVTGSHTIGVQIVGDTDSTISVANGAGLNATAGIDTIGALPTGKALTKTGSGTLEAKSVRSGNLAVNGGTLKITPHAAGLAPSVSKAAIVTVGAGGPSLDLTNNNMAITGMSADAVRQLILAGANGTGTRSWDGSGLKTSMGNANNLGIGYATLSQLGGIVPPGFTGESGLNMTDVLVKFTLFGDANMDGAVGAQDVSLLYQNLGSASGKTWKDGDFNYDGAVGAQDVSLLYQNLGQFAPAAPAGAPAGGIDFGGVAAVPEPGTLGALAIGGLGLLARRRRRSAK